MKPEVLADLAIHHKWTLLAALIIGFIVRLLKDDTRLPTIPARARVFLILALGVVTGVLEKIGSGTSWQDAAVQGFFAAMIAILGHEVVVKGARRGRDIPLPKILIKKPEALPLPAEPSTEPEIAEAPEAHPEAGEGSEGEASKLKSETDGT